MLYSFFELCNAMRNREDMTLCDTDDMVFTGKILGIELKPEIGEHWYWIKMYVAGNIVPNRILEIQTYPH